MAIISENKKRAFRPYGSTQFLFAMTYVLVTFAVLLFLNIYCSRTSQDLFYESKKTSMIEKCQLAADEIANLEVVNSATVTAAVEQMGSLKVSRLIITDQNGIAFYDSYGSAVGSYVLFPEIIQAIAGNDVYTCLYQNGIMSSHAATPISYYGNSGCVYMTEYDTDQGSLIRSLQNNVLRITLFLEIVVMFFALVFSTKFSKRLRKIMASMRIIQQGDYTHKVRMDGHDELAFLGNEFNDLMERLHTSEQKRARFVSDASHELKTPLASIKLLTDSILQNDMDMETIREFVGDIGDEAERLNRTTAKLLSLTKLDGHMDVDFEIINVAPTVQRVVRMLSSIAIQNEITIQTDLHENCPILILEDDLYQIVFNLVENGIKYNIPGGKLHILLHREDDNAILTFSDTGVGIPEDAMGHIFERFYRVDKARSRATGGSGLGLAIVRAIVQRYRGEITVTSTPGQGTTFTVIFPLFDTEVEEA